MTIIMPLWWSLARGNPVVPSRWQATARRHDPKGAYNDTTRRVHITRSATASPSRGSPRSPDRNAARAVAADVVVGGILS